MKKTTRITLAALATLLLAMPPGAALAHGQATSFSKIAGDYLVEFEYDQVGNPPAGDFIPYNFDLLDPNTKEFTEFSYAFIRFADADNKTTYVNGTIAADSFNPVNARMGVRLPEAGTYTVTARFYDAQDKEMAEAAFSLTVDPPYESRGLSAGTARYLWILTLVVGLVAGMAASRVLKKR